MKKYSILFCAFLSFLFAFSSCSDDTVDPFDPVAQAAADEALIKEYIAKDTLAAKTEPVRTPEGMYYVPVKAGIDPQVKNGNTVKVHYIGRFLNGSKFDSSYDRGVPLSFKVGVGGVIEGWDLALPMMKLNEQARFYIPSVLAYGRSGSSNIPPNTVLVFDINVLDIKP